MILAVRNLSLLAVLIGGAVSTVSAQAVENELGVLINKKPILDLAADVNRKIETRAVDMKAPFRIQVDGTLNKAGRLVDARVKTEGNKGTAAVARNAVMAISDSGWFAYLKNAGAKKIRIEVSQTADVFEAILRSGMQNVNKARAAATSLGLLLSMLRLTDSRSPDDKLMLESTSVSSDGSNCLVRLKLPAADVQRMIESRRVKTTTSE